MPARIAIFLELLFMYALVSSSEGEEDNHNRNAVHREAIRFIPLTKLVACRERLCDRTMRVLPGPGGWQCPLQK